MILFGMRKYSLFRDQSMNNHFLVSPVPRNRDPFLKDSQVGWGLLNLKLFSFGKLVK